MTTIIYYAHNVSEIHRKFIRAEHIYILKKDSNVKIPFKSLNYIRILIDNCKMYTMSDAEIEEIQTLVAFNILFHE